MLVLDGTTFRDSSSRQLLLRGINVAADAKLPSTPNLPSHLHEHFWDGDNVSFLNRPFSLADADAHFSRLRRWGYNTIRYIFTWEAIEHAGPGKYDEEWIDFTISVLRKAGEYGFYVFMDPHQDVWSRFSGGSGAPMWTVYACGLDPKMFVVTEAALVHNVQEKPEEFPKMIWSTNYTRLANQTIWTMFNAGREFAPKCVIDGANIQDYLMDHYLGAAGHLCRRICEAGGLEDEVVIGWESYNELNRGLIGHQVLDVIPPEQKLQKGTSPTAWQAIQLGSGRACEVETWDVGGMGSYKTGSKLVDPKGAKVWLSPEYDDSRYGWKRDPGWKLGECIWAQHGVWDQETNLLLKPKYFSLDPQTRQKIDTRYWVNHFFVRHFRAYKTAIRAIHYHAILFCQPPVLEIPPAIRGTPDEDPRMVYAPHYYDGLTLMTKHWNRVWNVDVLGVLRGRYWSPAFAIKLGETAIRNSMRQQLTAMRQEGLDNIGERPCMFTEIGIPYDMDDKHAYRTGDYSSQTSAMDANHFALEGCGAAGYSIWCYAAGNNHRWGDNWNGEDLSIFSQDDRDVASHRSSFLAPKSPTKEMTELGADSPAVVSLKRAASSNSMAKKPPPDLSASGTRAAEAFIRPYPVAVGGVLISYGFNMKTCTFTLKVRWTETACPPPQTLVFLPIEHFPIGETRIEAGSGEYNIRTDERGLQFLDWVHEAGESELKVVGKVRNWGAASSEVVRKGACGHDGVGTPDSFVCQNGCVIL